MLQHHVVVDGHVAGSLVGHVHIVPLRDQADEGAAHRDHVVIRVRREDQHGLGERCGRDRTRAVVRVGLAARPAGDRMLQVVEDPDVDLVVGAVQLQQFAQGVLQIVALRQLEDRRADRLAEPDHGLADELLRPVAGAHQPGGHHAREQAAGRRVDVEMDMVVPLQQRGRAGGRHLAFDDGLDRVGFIFSPRHQDDAARREHRGDAHRDGALRRGRKVVAEVARLALAGAVGEPHGAGARLLVAASFVEADLPLFADADDQQIQPARELVERGAVVGHFRLRDGPVRDVDILREDVHLVQERLVEAVVAALQLVRGGRVVFVDRDHLDVPEGHLTRLVAAQQLLIEQGRRDAGRQAEPEQPALAGLDPRDDHVRHGQRRRPGLRIDIRPDLLVVVQDAGGQVLFDQAAFVG